MVGQPDHDPLKPNAHPIPRRSVPASLASANATPAMAQWFAAKEAHPDALLFFRMGDFYELFFSDAEAAAAALDIVLSHRGEHNGVPIPMCGVPKHAAEAYLARLIRRGYRVAVAEQMEDPKTRASAKTPIRREIVRLITPGTLTEEALLDAGQPNLLLGLARGQDTSWAPRGSTFRPGFSKRRRCRPAICPRCSAAWSPPRSSRPKPCRWANGHRRGPETVPSPPLVARRRLADLFQTASIDAFGTFNDAEAVAAMVAVDYVRSTQAGALPRLARPMPTGDAGVMAMDAATRASLEIHRARDGGVLHTLLAAVKHTVTPAGARLSGIVAGGAADRPRCDRGAAGCLVLDAGQPQATIRLRAALRTAPDLARALGRLSLNRGGPRRPRRRARHAGGGARGGGGVGRSVARSFTSAHAILARDCRFRRP